MFNVKLSRKELDTIRSFQKWLKEQSLLVETDDLGTYLVNELEGINIKIERGFIQ